MHHYDYLFVGAGVLSVTLAHKAMQLGKACLVLEKRNHIGGNIYTENDGGINVHKYGAHIFHTDSREVWGFVNQFAEFNRYTNCPVANYNGTLYNLLFNMNTFTKIWSDVITPEDAKKRIAEQAEYPATWKQGDEPYYAVNDEKTLLFMHNTRLLLTAG